MTFFQNSHFINKKFIYNIFTFFNISKYLLILICVLILVAFYTLYERKIMANSQRRDGPKIVGFSGLLQAFADGLKLLLKEFDTPADTNKAIFTLTPYFVFGLAILCWSIIPIAGLEHSYVKLEYNLLIFFAISTINVYGTYLAGWSSNSNFAFLGGLRAAAQMISYEIAFSVIILIIVFSAGSLAPEKIVLAQAHYWFIFQHFPIAVLFYLTILAETNRHPYDFVEAESELVSGYNVEYGGMPFALYFLAEYANMILMSLLASLLFLGGWSSTLNYYLTNPFIIISVKTVIVMWSIVLIRISVPRFRYDALMEFGWKTVLPFSFAWLIIIIAFTLTFGYCAPMKPFVNLEI